MGNPSVNPNTTQYVTTKTELPQWYQDYLTNVMGKAQNVAETPYQAYGAAPVRPKDIGPPPDPKDEKYKGAYFDPTTGTMIGGSADYKADKAAYDKQKASYDAQMESYTGAQAAWDALTPEQRAMQGQRVAGMNQAQRAALDSINNLQGAFNPAFDQAGGTINRSGYASTNADVMRYVDAAQNAGLGQFSAAEDLYGASADRDTAALFDPYGLGATDFTYQAGQRANPLIEASTNPTGLTAAAPFLASAGQSAAGGISEYANPYDDAVVNRIGDLAARNLQEKLLPTISADFIRAGQYGSTRQQDIMRQALRDTQEAALAEQANVLRSGYESATANAQADASRRAGLAGTAGSLGSQQQQALLGAGQTLGNLGLGQASTLSGIGSTSANAAAVDAARQIQAAQGMSNIGQAQQQQAMGLASLTSQNQLADYARMLQAGVAQGNLASQGMQTQLAGIGAQNALGTQQQQVQQTSLDTAYQDFLNQRNHPQQQVDFLSAIVHGLPVNTSSYQSATGPGSVAQMQPSAIGQIAGAGVGLTGLSKLFSKGGAVRYARGGRVRAPTGLGSFKRAA